MEVKHKLKLKNIPIYCTVLKEIRESKNIKQEDLAKKLKISTMGLSLWERGERSIKVEQLDLWSKSLGKKLTIEIN